MFKTECATPEIWRRGTGLLHAAALLSLAILCTGCQLHQKKFVRPFVYPPAPPLKAVNLTVPQVEEAPDMVVSIDELEIASAVPSFSPPPPPAPRRPPPAKAVAVQPVVVEPPTAPKIAQIFTADQLRENNRALDESLGRVQKALDTLAKRNLTAEQRSRMEQIQDFQTQAKQARAADLVTAVSLAKHADLLAKDLIDHLP
jgi:hypothetical protein